MSIVQMSVSAAFLIIAVTVIRSVALNRLPKVMFLVLWGIILVRLFVPFSFSIPIPVQSHTLEAVNNVIVSVSNTAPQTFHHEQPFAQAIDPVVPFDAAVPFVPAAPAVTAPPARDISVISFIWLSGVLIALSYFTFVFFASRRKLHTARPVTGDSGFFSLWLDHHRILRPVTIMQSDKVTSPLTSGIFRPKIILPENMDLSDRRLLSHILVHEYHHIKRGDAIIKMLLVAALCLHWFNPLVWVMFVLANRDLELSCDEKVVRYFGMETKEAYAYSIIDMAEQRSRFAPFFSGFTKNAAEERIHSIMKIKKPSIPSWGISYALSAVLALGGFSMLTAAPAYFHADDVSAPVALPGEPAQLSPVLSVSPPPPSGTAIITVPQAREIAFSMASGGNVSALELVSGAGGVFTYNIIIEDTAARYEVSMNAHTGEIFRFFSNHLPAPEVPAETAPQVGITLITVPQAREIAFSMASGGNVSALELVSGADGVFAYNIIIDGNAARYEVSINARTGEIFRFFANRPPAPDAPFEMALSSVIAHGAVPQVAAQLDQAAAVALARAGGGAVRHICLDWERGHAVYHVRVYNNGNRMDYYIDRGTLAVVHEHSRRHQNASASSSSFQRRQMNVTPAISFNQAAAIALAYKGGGTVREVSRSSTQGRPAFDVDIVVNGQRWCFYIDIHTGHIIRYHRD